MSEPSLVHVNTRGSVISCNSKIEFFYLNLYKGDTLMEIHC